jgi:ribosomal protein L11 methylase PrmA
MIVPHPSSFRDPRGFIFEQDGLLYRQVNESGRAGYEALMGSGLYEELAAKQLLVSHEEVDAPGAADAWKVLKPELVPFISYPYEWSFGQLKKAALTTLRIQKIALRHGMTLRDASAFNVQFIGSQAVFIDTLSFESYQEGQPWVAYRQFCQHFLAPLFLIAGSDPRLSALSRSWIDGIPLDIARRLTPRPYRWRPGFLAHISLHSKAQERFKDDAARRPRRLHVRRAALERIIDHLRATTEGLSWNPAKTQWAGYYSMTNYTDEAMESKKRFVAAVVNVLKPARVVDLGANTGEFSVIAARAGAYVVAADVDCGAVELCFRRASAEKDRRVLPLVVDLANPTPPLGWMNAERASFLERCAGKTDLVLALALVHHLVIGNNVPLRSVMELFFRTGADVIVEFIEKNDTQVQRLLASRDDIFEDYSVEGFERALSGLFRIVTKQPLPGARRLLYHVHRLPPG